MLQVSTKYGQIKLMHVQHLHFTFPFGSPPVFTASLQTKANPSYRTSITKARVRCISQNNFHRGPPKKNQTTTATHLTKI
jgi:hypothetical protein